MDYSYFFKEKSFRLNKRDLVSYYFFILAIGLRLFDKWLLCYICNNIFVYKAIFFIIINSFTSRCKNYSFYLIERCIWSSYFFSLSSYIEFGNFFIHKFFKLGRGDSSPIWFVDFLLLKIIYSPFKFNEKFICIADFFIIGNFFFSELFERKLYSLCNYIENLWVPYSSKLLSYNFYINFAYRPKHKYLLSKNMFKRYLYFCTYRINKRYFFSIKNLKKTHQTSETLLTHRVPLQNFVLLSDIYSLFIGNSIISKSKFLINEKTIYFYNLHKNFLWKLRKTRLLHWDIRLNGKLNKYRYDKLLAAELKSMKSLSLLNLISFFFIHYFCWNFTWKEFYKLMDYKLLLINGKFTQLNYYLSRGDILELPFGVFLFLSKYKYLHKQLKSASTFSKKMYLLLNKDEVSTPIRYGLKYSKYFSLVFKLDFYICYMPGLNIFYICDDNKKICRHIEYELLSRTVSSLYNWRYNFD